MKSPKFQQQLAEIGIMHITLSCPFQLKANIQKTQALRKLFADDQVYFTTHVTRTIPRAHKRASGACALSVGECVRGKGMWITGSESPSFSHCGMLRSFLIPLYLSVLLCKMAIYMTGHNKIQRTRVLKCGEGEGGMIWENGILTCILSCKNRIATMSDAGYSMLGAGAWG